MAEGPFAAVSAALEAAGAAGISMIAAAGNYDTDDERVSFCFPL